jgi:general secretion pathway protein A
MTKRRFTEWFGLNTYPFGKDLDHSVLYAYPQLEELHQILDLTLESCSAALVTGQAGTGKTTAVRGFVETLPTNQYRVIYLGNDQTGHTLFARLALELGLKLSHANGQRMLQLKNHIQRHITGAGRQLVLVIDEAHLLDGRTLEDIRLLTNSQMDRRSDVILVLLGQLWLRSKLKNLGHEALYQRMRFRYGLEGLSRKQTSEYIQHHLQLVGCKKQLFTPAALEQLFLASGGILREINNLCVDCLLKASNLSKTEIDPKIVKMVTDQRDTA